MFEIFYILKINVIYIFSQALFIPNYEARQKVGCNIVGLRSDEQEQIKIAALTVGVDKVVIKSPEAGEIVSLVSSELL